ncbi:MAG: O-antigen ligase family protein, partial [Patescibacteria group bacterium]
MGFLILGIAVLYFLITIRNFRYGLFIFLAALPSYLIRFKIPLGTPFVKGEVLLPTTMLEVMFWILFFIWITRMGLPTGQAGSRPANNTNIGVISAPPWRGLVKSRMFFPIVLFFASSIIAIFVSPNWWQSLGIWRAYFLEPMLFFAMLLTLGHSVSEKSLPPSGADSLWERERSTWGHRVSNTIVWPLAISVFYVSIIAIAQRFFGWPIPYPWQSELRVTSIFEYPNAVGLFIAPILMLILGFLISRIFATACPVGRPACPVGRDCTDTVTPPRPPLVRGGNETIRVIRGPVGGALVKSRALFDVKTFFLIVTFFLGILAIILAKSDGAIVGLAAGLAVLGIIYNRKTRLAAAILLIAIAIVILAVPSVNQLVGEKFLLGDWSGYVRQTIWGETWQMLKDNPLLGAGLAGYQTVFAPYHQAKGIEIFMYPHNIFFNFWSELGMLGLLGFIWMIVEWFKKTISNFQFPISRPFTIAVLSSMIVILVHGLVDVPYFKNDLAFLFWIIFAMPFILIPPVRISTDVPAPFYLFFRQRRIRLGR